MEKEIERLIESHVRYDPMTEESWGAAEAAHAIAEAYRNGVVWEGTDKAALGVLPGGLCGDEYFDVVELGKGTGIGLDSFSLCIEGSEKDGWVDGQEYRVTVTKVEGDND